MNHGMPLDYKEMPKVYVVSQDWTLRANLRAELIEAGFEALGMESMEDLVAELAAGRTPSAVVLDSGEVSPATRSALIELAGRVPTVIVASRPSVVGGHAVMIVRATYLYRPVRIGEIVAQVKQLLAGQVA